MPPDAPIWKRLLAGLAGGVAATWGMVGAALAISLLLVLPVIVLVAVVAWGLTGIGLAAGWIGQYALVAIQVAIWVGVVWLLARWIWRRTHRN